MKARWVLLLCAVVMGAARAELPLAPVTCDYGQPSSSAPAETSQFGFLIGDYKIHLHAWRNDAWTPPQPDVTARWNGRYGLNGMVIEDEWFNPDPAQDANGNAGINVRMYDPEQQVWKMMWIATSGRVVQDLRAEMRDGVLTMWQVYPERPDFKATFHVHDEDHWDRVSYTRHEDGNWVRQFKLAASRIPCE